MEKLKNLWQAITNAGVSDEQSPHFVKRLRLTNQLSATIAVITAPYLVIFAAAKAYVLSALIIPIVLGYALVPFLNRLGFVNATRIWMVILCNTAVTSYTFALGESAGIHLYYYANVCLPVVVFKPREKIKLLIGIALPTALYSTLILTGFKYQPLVNVSATAAMYITFSIAASTIATIVAALLYLFLSNYRAEDNLLQTVEQLKAEVQEKDRANMAKSAFLATMSHELRTPLGIMTGFLELLDSDDIEADHTETMAAIQRNAKHLLELIDDILDLSKIESGTSLTRKVPTYLIREVSETLAQLENWSQEKGIGFHTTIDDDVPRNAITDPLRLRQIVLNVVGNAIKFTEQGQVNVRVSVATTDDNSRLLSIRVDDTGIGIEDDAKDKIFEPFHQVDSSATRPYAGTGLGLALSRQLARALGGDITLNDSTAGRGSSFTITIDLGPGGATFQSVQPASGQQSEFQPNVLADRKFLVVEDNPDTQMIMQKLLQSVGANVVLANDGREAIELADKDFDAILMDIQLPHVGGNEAIRAIRLKGNNTPIIAISAFAMQHERNTSFEAGCNDYLTKPVDRAQLVNTLARWLMLW